MAESQGETSDKGGETKGDSGSTDKLFNKFLTEVKLVAFISN